jgi:hypothetical protein
MDPGAMALMIPIFGMMIGGLAIFVRSHLGHALADRISGRTGPAPEFSEELRELRGEVESLRAELMETQERLDFTERLLATGKDDR